MQLSQLLQVWRVFCQPRQSDPGILPCLLQLPFVRHCDQGWDSPGLSKRGKCRLLLRYVGQAKCNVSSAWLNTVVVRCAIANCS